MKMCDKCTKMSGWLLLVLGVLFLGKDLGWFTWWVVSGWTVVFLFFGFMKLGKSSCKECQTQPKKK